MMMIISINDDDNDDNKTGNIYIIHPLFTCARRLWEAFKRCGSGLFFYCANTTTRPRKQGTLFFYLEETTASQEGNGQKPSEIKTYSDFAKRKRDPSSSIFVILSVTTSSSKKIVDPGNGETNKFSAFNVNRTAWLTPIFNTPLCLFKHLEISNGSNGHSKFTSHGSSSSIRASMHPGLSNKKVNWHAALSSSFFFFFIKVFCWLT